MKKIKISFLLGSGVSLCASSPSTNQLTESLLNDKNIIQHSSKLFYYSTKDDLSKQLVTLIQKFLKYLKMQIKEYYAWLDKANLNNIRMLNYESIYYFVWQLWSCSNGEYDNPAIFKLYKEVHEKFILELNKLDEDFFDNISFTVFLENVLRYIEDIVSKKLEIRLREKCNYLQVIHEANEDTRIKNIEIFSLNHDILIEQYLDLKKIEYCDGFIKKDLEIRVWDPRSFNNSDFKINLYKLHGSINWFQFRRKNREWFIGNVPINIKDIDHIKDPSNTTLYRINRHLMLIGTFNKMFEYLTDIFIELHCRFFKKLLESDCLVISGYSFNDKGVNFNIRRFTQASFNKKIIIINPNPEELRSNSRGMIDNNWDGWILAKQMEIIRKKFEETQLDNIIVEFDHLRKP